MKLRVAKRCAIEMANGTRPGIRVADPILKLNRMAAVLAELDATNN
jgi:hypothetical protein